MPAKEADFLDWSANLIAVSKTNVNTWKLPQDQLTALETLHNEVKVLHQVCQTSSYTKLDMQAKNEKKALLIKREEVFVRNNLQNNDLMTDNGREQLRIPIHDLKPTPTPKPEGVPEVEVSTPLPRTLRFRFRAENAKRWGKPAYVHGIEVLWVIAGTPPVHIKELTHSEFATKNPLDLSFDEDQRGKRVYFAARWESGTVKKGPESDIFSAVIP
jgi:hypothetical protein